MKVAIKETDVCESESGLDFYFVFEPEVHFHFIITFLRDEFYSQYLSRLNLFYFEYDTKFSSSYLLKEFKITWFIFSFLSVSL